MPDARPLDDAALARLREDLASGKRPALVLLAGGAGLPAGSRGQLVRMDEPPQDAEFLHVRVGNDELPFAPEEVGLPRRRSRTVVRAEPRSPEPILEPERPDRRTRSARVVEPPPAPPEPTVPGPDPVVAERPAAEQAGSDVVRKPRRQTRSGGAPAKITLTVRFADFAWTVEALVAGRRDKPQPVPLAAIRAFADQLEDQSLRRQLETTIQACRDEAQKKASALRAELARLETELAALDD
jgi:hypothetical protein